MTPEPQRQNPIARFWWWLVGLVAAFLRFIGFNVSWGRTPDKEQSSARSSLDRKEQELADFLSELAAQEGRIAERYGEEFLLAAERGDQHFFELYLAFGMPVNYQHPKTGETALHIAARRRARRIVRVLIQRPNVSYLIRDNQGRLASELAHLYGRDAAVARMLGLKERAQGEERGVTVELR